MTVTHVCPHRTPCWHVSGVLRDLDMATLVCCWCGERTTWPSAAWEPRPPSDSHGPFAPALTVILR